MKILRNIKLVAMLAAIAVATGCVNVQSLPSYARTGDLVSVGLAGIKFNTDGARTLQPDDLTVTITDSASTVHNVRVNTLFRAYPDHTSFYATEVLESSNTAGGAYSFLRPYDGQWWVNVWLVDPASADPNNPDPLPLALGDATLSVSSPYITDTFGSDGDLTSINIRIIAGTASPTDDDFYQYSAYKPAKALTVQPDSLAGVTTVGGMQIKLDYDPAALDAVATTTPRLVPMSHDPNINIIQHTIDNGDGTHALIAMVTNPEGFVDFESGWTPGTSNTGWTAGQSSFDDLNFAVIAQDDFATWASDYSLDAAESFYIDENGDEILTSNPVLGINY